eukprot:6212218-Pleurochrysis_carterae.AAC.1
MGTADSDVTMGKLRILTFCGSKGCEADCVIVLGLDVYDETKIVSRNQIGVALSRARQQLIVQYDMQNEVYCMDGCDKEETVMHLETMHDTNVITIHDDGQEKKRKRKKERTSNEEEAVVDFIRSLDVDTVDEIDGTLQWWFPVVEGSPPLKYESKAQGVRKNIGKEYVANHYGNAVTCIAEYLLTRGCDRLERFLGCVEPEVSEAYEKQLDGKIPHDIRVNARVWMILVVFHETMKKYTHTYTQLGKKLKNYAWVNEDTVRTAAIRWKERIRAYAGYQRVCFERKLNYTFIEGIVDAIIESTKVEEITVIHECKFTQNLEPLHKVQLYVYCMMYVAQHGGRVLGVLHNSRTNETIELRVPDTVTREEAIQRLEKLISSFHRNKRNNAD